MAKSVLALSVFMAGGLVLAACGDGVSSNSSSTLSGTINGIGASSQNAAQTAWIQGFGELNPRVSINYDPQGSGAGRRNFISGASDFGGSDVPFTTRELELNFASCLRGRGGLELPVYISPIVLAFNLKGVNDLRLDPAVLAGIFRGNIVRWNDPMIAALNPGISLPHSEIIAIHRSDDSGTTENFTSYLEANAAGVWGKKAAQTFPYAGEAAKGTSGIAELVRSTANSIGYIDFWAAGKMALAKLRVGAGFSSPTAEGATMTAAESHVTTDVSGSPVLEIDRQITTSGSWPLILASYLLVCQKYENPAQGKLVGAYIKYIASDKGQEVAKKYSGSAPLPRDLAEKIVTIANQIE